MNRIHIQHMTGPSIAESPVEIVERKGLGHPDSICDAVMEHIAQALHQAYLDQFGHVLHYNCDKGLLAAGCVERRFGGGRVVEPMRLVIGDRATTSWGGRSIDVARIAISAAKDWFRHNLPHVDPDRHVNYQVELRPGSQELTGLFTPDDVRRANDTSAVVGYAPLSATEQLVLATENYLNSNSFKAAFPETGQDVKVMGVRVGRHTDLTVAMPLLDRYVQSEADYFQRKNAIHQAALAHLRTLNKDLDYLALGINTLDQPGAGMAGIYLSVLGTSAEDADSGAVGRGNQVNGLIALNRPRGSEAAAGKNSVSHIGKIYSVLAHLLAARIHAEVPGVEEAVVYLCSKIGQPISEPWIALAQIRLSPGSRLADMTTAVRKQIETELDRLPLLCSELAQGRYAVC